MSSVNIFRGGLSRRINNLIVPFLFFGFLNDTVIVQKISSNYGNQILVSNSQGMKNNVYEELDKIDKVEGNFTFESALSEAKGSLNEYFSSAEYRIKLENEVKIEKYELGDLTPLNFEEKIASVTLSLEDKVRIDTIISERVKRLGKIVIEPVKQIAFSSPVKDKKGIISGYKFTPDLEGSVVGFYYDDLYKGTHYLGVWTDNGFTTPEFGKVYILDLFSLSSSFGTNEQKLMQMKATIFHELGGHGIMEYKKNITEGGSRALKWMTSKRKNDPVYKDYLGDESEFQSRMLEFRDMLFLLGKIPTISSPIEESHITALISHYKNNGDEVSVMLLKKYKALELINIMNGITMNEKLDALDTRIG